MSRTRQKTAPGVYPCPLCSKPMSAHLDLISYVGFSRYVKASVKFDCQNDKCRYEERTRGHSVDEKTIAAMLDLCAGFRAAEMFKRGRFNEGSVGVNRRRHTGIYGFAPVDPPVTEGNK